MTPETWSWIERLEGSFLSLATIIGLAVYLSVWADTKIGADLQARVGPNRAGSAGILQPLADFLRLLLKVRHSESGARARVFWWIQGLPLFAMVSLVPAGSRGPLLAAPLAVFIAPILGLCFAWVGLLLNWQAESVESRFGSLRQGALAIAATPPALMAIAVAGMTVGGFEWNIIDSYQGFLPIHWLALSNPFSFVAAIIFLAAGMLMFAMPPFSGRQWGQLSLVASMSGAVGVREAWVRISHRVAPICWSLVAVQIFFGGGRLPPLLTSWLGDDSSIAWVLQSALLIIKVLAIHLMFSIAGRTLPAVRSDQAHDFAWRVLSPAAILALVGLRLLGLGFLGVTS